MLIKLSNKSQKLIKKLIKKSPGKVHYQQDVINISLQDALSLLSIQSEINNQAIKDKEQKEIEFVLVSLRAELLHDLCESLGSDSPPSNKLAVQHNNKLKFVLLTIAGVLVAACEGFDSITTILGIFSFSPGLILACGLVFSGLAAIAFCGLNLIKLSSSLGMKFSDAHKLLDIYLQQLNEIKQIRKKISTYSLANLSLDKLRQYEQILELLQKHLDKLAETSEQFDAALNSTPMQVLKFGLSMVTAALFFGGSFCAGQTVSLFILGLFLTAITPASLPVLLFSTFVGLAAFSLYWCVEFPELKTLVSGWFGLDDRKIDMLCDKDLLHVEQQKLVKLKTRIADMVPLKEQHSVLEFTLPRRALTAPSQIGNIPFFKQATPINNEEFSAGSDLAEPVCLGLNI